VGQKTVFVCYCWAEANAVDKIEQSLHLEPFGIELIRDIRNLPQLERISNFEKRIRECDLVLILISDSFLKSPHCMFEVIETIKNEDFENKIVTVVMEDARKIYKPGSQNEYIKFWLNELERMKETAEGIPLNLLKDSASEASFLAKIPEQISSFISLLKDINNFNYCDLENVNFEPLEKYFSDIIGVTEEDYSKLLKILELKDFDEVLSALEKYREKNGESSIFFSVSSYAKKKFKFFKGAKTDAEKAWKLDPRNPSTIGVFAGALFALGDEESAKHYFEVALGINPNHTPAHNNLGNVLRKMGDKDGARHQYEEALRIDPDNVDAQNNLGSLLGEMGDKEGAKKFIKGALSINPSYYMAYYNLGNILIEMGDKDGARHQYEEALRINPNYVEAHNNLGTILAEIGDKEVAKYHYQEALRIDPNYAPAHSNLGALLAGIGDKEGAKYHYQEALRIDPKFADPHNNLGFLLAEIGDNEGAKYHYQEALRIDPNHILAQNNLGALPPKK
jgi:tetratricopeptide (TPR) repeat protein